MTEPGLEPTAIRAFLLACLAATPSPQVREMAEGLTVDGWTELLRLAAAQRVRPLLAKRLSAEDMRGIVPESVTISIRESCLAIGIRTLHLHRALIEILNAARAREIPVLVLKGAYLGPMIYGNIALREMNDLDVLVPMESVEAMASILDGFGYAPVHAAPVAAELGGSNHHLARRLRPPYAGVEIHWRLSGKNVGTSIDDLPLWQDAQPATWAGVEALALSHEDQLLHVCHHAVYQHDLGFGLRPLCDVVALLGSPIAIDWARFMERARAGRCAMGAGLLLALARTHLGAPVPIAVIEGLSAPGAATAERVASDLLWSPSADFAALTSALTGLGSATWWQRASAVARRILVPRKELAQMHPSSASSPWWPIYYCARGWSLLRRHGNTAVRLVRKTEASLSEVAEKQRGLRNWLQDSE